MSKGKALCVIAPPVPNQGMIRRLVRGVGQLVIFEVAALLDPGHADDAVVAKYRAVNSMQGVFAATQPQQLQRVSRIQQFQRKLE